METERPAPDDVTDAMNRVCDEIGDTRDEFVAAAARLTLERIEYDFAEVSWD